MQSNNVMCLIRQQKAFQGMRIGKAGITRRALISSPTVGGKMMRVPSREIMKLNTWYSFFRRQPRVVLFTDSYSTRRVICNFSILFMSTR